jgi:hypothetical protein
MGKFSLCSKLCCNDSRSGSGASNDKLASKSEMNRSMTRGKKFAIRSRVAKSTRKIQRNLIKILSTALQRSNTRVALAC